MSETRIREDICRFGRSLFERGLTPGSSGNISVKLDDGGWLVTPTNASLGFLDPARLSRLGADGRLVSGDAPTKEVPLHTALYQTRSAARAVVHLHSTHSVALSMLPEIDPARRAAADDALLSDEMRRTPRSCPIIAPAIPRWPTRSRGWPENIHPCCSPITARWCQATRWKPRCSRSRNWKRRRSCICCCAG